MKIAVLAGDGIGPEVMTQALRVLAAIATKFKLQFDFTDGLIGGAAHDQYQVHFPDETQQICEAADAILFGSIGGPIDQAHLPKWDGCEVNSLLALRKAFCFKVNYRPAKVYPMLKEICPLKDAIIENGIDILILRELLGGIYFGEHKVIEEGNQLKAIDVCEYSESDIEPIAVAAFDVARLRKKRVLSVDKANVLQTSKLWRAVFNKVGKRYPDIELKHMLVDNCAMQLITNPSQFDVIATTNMFGDILSDAAAVLPGSLGLMPSASLNQAGFGMYEPSGGSAPDIAGKNIANPIAQILSAAMMLRYSFKLEDAAMCIETAVNKTLEAGFRTADIASKGAKSCSTGEMTDQIIKHCG
ncbi:MAG: 3-isopropylmalate dehydrogenase [Coxiella sp. (in: Bacteria)]|nr:MAG: 3-isopropylmalate dehydrogenase [Coxiella sp. (in: g-proteobacteria)]